MRLGQQNIEVDALALMPYFNSARFVARTTPLVSTSWDGDARSTTAKTLIDLSAVFGVPAGIKGVLLYVAIRDSGSAATDTYLILGPNSTANSGMGFSCLTVNDRWARYGGVTIPCSTDGDIYYQIAASGASTFDVLMEVWGYWQ